MEYVAIYVLGALFVIFILDGRGGGGGGGFQFASRMHIFFN
jgi:hypothetical protein